MFDLHEIQWAPYFENGVKKYSKTPRWVSTPITNRPYAVIRSKMKFLSADRKCPDGTKFIPLPNGTNVYDWIHHGNKKVSSTSSPGLGDSHSLSPLELGMANENSSPSD